MLPRLPPELRCCILEHLGSLDVLSMACVSRSLSGEAVRYLYTSRFASAGATKISKLLCPPAAYGLTGVRNDDPGSLAASASLVIGMLSRYLQHASRGGSVPSLDLYCSRRHVWLPVLPIDTYRPMLVNVRSSMSIFHWAVLAGSAEVVEYLLTHGAKFDACVEMDEISIGDLSHRCSARSSLGPLEPVTPLSIATLVGHSLLVSKLVLAGAPARAQWTAAVASGMSPIVRAYLTLDPSLIESPVAVLMRPLKYVAYLVLRQHRDVSVDMIAALIFAIASRPGCSTADYRSADDLRNAQASGRAIRKTVRLRDFSVDIDGNGHAISLNISLPPTERQCFFPPRSDKTTVSASAYVCLDTARRYFADVLARSVLVNDPALYDYDPSGSVRQCHVRHFRMIRSRPNPRCRHYAGVPSRHRPNKVSMHNCGSAFHYRGPLLKFDRLLADLPPDSALDETCARVAVIMVQYVLPSAAGVRVGGLDYRTIDAAFHLLRYVFEPPGSRTGEFSIFPRSPMDLHLGSIVAHDALGHHRREPWDPGMDVCVFNSLGSEPMGANGPLNGPLNGICRVRSRRLRPGNAGTQPDTDGAESHGEAEPDGGLGHGHEAEPATLQKPVVLSLLLDSVENFGLRQMASWHVTQFRAMAKSVWPGQLTVRTLLGIIVRGPDWFLVATERSKDGFQLHKPVSLGRWDDVPGALSIVRSLHAVRQQVEEDVKRPYRADLRRSFDSRAGGRSGRAKA